MSSGDNIKNFHEAVSKGNIKLIKSYLRSGEASKYILSTNHEGHSALFISCLDGNLQAVQLLLLHGARPTSSLKGSTAMHAACFGGNIKILRLLLEVGADFRLHDNLGRTGEDWARRQPNLKRRKKVLEFLEDVQALAHIYCSQEALESQEGNPSAAIDRLNLLLRETKSLEKRIFGRDRRKHFPDIYTNSCTNFGFGKVFFNENFGWTRESVRSVPMVPETHLRHDNGGLTFSNGLIMIMESMFWNDTPVTVKRLRKRFQDGGHVDLLIRENQYMSSLHHCNILLLMAVHQTVNMDGLVLLYERVNCGSLNDYIHHQAKTMSIREVCNTFSQACSGLMYLHGRRLLHCGLSSYAIQLTHSINCSFVVKLVNFELVTPVPFENISGEKASPEKRKPKVKSRRGPPGVVVNKGTELPKKDLSKQRRWYFDFLNNWTSPEVLAGDPPTKQSDVYSLCAVIWEVLNKKIPWQGLKPPDIIIAVAKNQHSLSLESIPPPFLEILQLGLSWNLTGRNLTVDMLEAHLSAHLNSDDLDLPLDKHKPAQAVESVKDSIATGTGSAIGVNSTFQDIFMVPVMSNSQGNQLITSDDNRLGRQIIVASRAVSSSTTSSSANRSNHGDPVLKDDILSKRLSMVSRSLADQELFDPTEETERSSGSSNGLEVVHAPVDFSSNAPAYTSSNEILSEVRKESDINNSAFPHEERFVDIDMTQEVDDRDTDDLDRKADDLARDEVDLVLKADAATETVDRVDDSDALTDDSGKSNPFLDKKFQQESIELYKQIKFLPRLCTANHSSMCSSSRLFRKPTVYDTIIGQFADGQRKKISPKPHRPTFGISLNELKSVIASRVPSSQNADNDFYDQLEREQVVNYGSCFMPSMLQQTQSNTSHTMPFLTRSRQSNSNQPRRLMSTYKPASHCEPSLNMSQELISPRLCQNSSLPPHLLSSVNHDAAQSQSVGNVPSDLAYKQFADQRRNFETTHPPFRRSGASGHCMTENFQPLTPVMDNSEVTDPFSARPHPPAPPPTPSRTFNKSTFDNQQYQISGSRSLSNNSDEFYFDDELNSRLYKEKYMRLQSTMLLDSVNDDSIVTDFSSFHDNPSPSKDRPLTSAHSESNNMCSVCSRQWSHNSNQERDRMKISTLTSSGNISTVTVRTDSRGHHKICIKQKDSLTGSESPTYKASVVADQLVTEVVINTNPSN